MNKLYILLPFLTLLIATNTSGQNDTLNMLNRNAYTLFELTRNEAGVNRDSKKLGDKNPAIHPASCAGTGDHFISISIAAHEGWISKKEIENLILTKLKPITG